MNIDISNIDFSSFELDGMVFQKALVSHNMTREQAEKVLKFCEWLHYMKIKSPPEYNKWMTSIKNRLKKYDCTDEELNLFIEEYIDRAIVPSTGKLNITCISENFTDINIYRKMVSLFYWNIVEPTLSKKNKREVKKNE